MERLEKIRWLQTVSQRHHERIVEKTPFYVALYNLHLEAQLSPERKEAFQQTINFYLSLNPLEDSHIPTTIELDFDTEYQDFYAEYTAMRRFIDEWIENKVSADSIRWLNIHLRNIVHEMGVTFAENGTIFSISQVCPDENFIKEAYPEEAEMMTKAIREMRFIPTQLDFIQRPILKLSNIESIFFQIAVELQRLIEAQKELRRCQALQTQRTPKCQNIFIPRAEGKKQIYCSPKCRARMRRREQYKRERKRRERN